LGTSIKKKKGRGGWGKTGGGGGRKARKRGGGVSGLQKRGSIAGLWSGVIYSNRVLAGKETTSNKEGRKGRQKQEEQRGEIRQRKAFEGYRENQKPWVKKGQPEKTQKKKPKPGRT